MRIATARALALVLLVALTLGACGKKGPPKPPADEPNIYPRTYPNQ